MSTALCKNRYFADLIKKRQVSLGMTKEMVESAWGAPWRKTTAYVKDRFAEVWEWGSNTHSRVRFDANNKVEHIYSVASTGKEGWSR
jgi:hypothetical protein